MPVERDAMSQSDGTADSHMPEHPQRVSALYQYHNAPEVAPAHGLEYDDSNYPHSDKYPVIHSMPGYNSKWTNKDYGHEGKPPRIIFGMKTRTFLVVAAIMIMVIVGAAVGGAVGGSTIKSSNPMSSVTSNATTTANATSSATSSAIASATASAYSAPLPTYGPVSDCPQANYTVYSSAFYSGSYGTVQPSTKLNFTRYCDVASPLAPSNIQLSTFVYSFEDCIEACASLNFYNNNGGCNLAAFRLNASRPANCWVGATNMTYDNLTMAVNVDVAFLHS